MIFLNDVPRVESFINSLCWVLGNFFHNENSCTSVMKVFLYSFFLSIVFFLIRYMAKNQSDRSSKFCVYVCVRERDREREGVCNFSLLGAFLNGIFKVFF